MLRQGKLDQREFRTLCEKTMGAQPIKELDDASVDYARSLSVIQTRNNLRMRRIAGLVDRVAYMTVRDRSAPNEPLPPRHSARDPHEGAA